MDLSGVGVGWGEVSGLAGVLIGRTKIASTMTRYASHTVSCITVGVGVTFNTPWMISPYQDDQLNH